jgi:hypothetical protein
MEGYPPFIKGLGPMPIGQGSALTPFPFGVTLKGLGVNPRVRPSPCPLGQGNMVSQKKKLCQCPLGHSPKGAHFLDTIFRESTCKHSLQGPLALYKWKGYPPFIKGLGRALNPRVNMVSKKPLTPSPLGLP